MLLFLGNFTFYEYIMTTSPATNTTYRITAFDLISILFHFSICISLLKERKKKNTSNSLYI